MDQSLTVALGQMQPVWLDRAATLARIEENIIQAADAGAGLIAFGEALAPGYPFWLDHTGGARFNNPLQKTLFAHYLQQAVHIRSGHLRPICKLCTQRDITVVLGMVERGHDRGNHSLYCSLVVIRPVTGLASVHRKLMPTYEERLVWSVGDGAGLVTHSVGDFTMGALNCWENWMPLVRGSLYAQGENLHVAIWPGSEHNTEDITRFIAKESRSYVLSASSRLLRSEIPDTIPEYDKVVANMPNTLADGGSCIAGPDGEWVVPPVTGRDEVIIATLDPTAVYRERQNFDPSGHYSRPDVTQLQLNRQRQRIIEIK